MRKRVLCIHRRPTEEDPHRHITHVGVGRDHRWTEKLAITQVIRQLESPTGDRYYIRGEDGSEADVRLRNCPHCGRHLYIRTTPDHSKADDLLKLPECSG
jgi:hypothetical protein